MPNKLRFKDLDGPNSRVAGFSEPTAICFKLPALDLFSIVSFVDLKPCYMSSWPLKLAAP